MVWWKSPRVSKGRKFSHETEILGEFRYESQFPQREELIPGGMYPLNTQENGK